MLLHHFLDRTAHRLPDKTALVCDGRRHTYAELARRVDALAGVLRAGGVRRGDRVALFLDNGPELVAGIFAALRLGAVFVPINPLTKREKLAHVLNDAEASAMIAHWPLKNAWEPALAANASVRCCLVAGVPAAKAGVLPARCQPYPEAGEPSTAAGIEAATIDQDLASIIYTSGTTGDPKGVMMSHLNMISAAHSVIEYLGLRDDDVIMCVLPLAFSYGLYQLLMSVRVGATLVLEQSFAFPTQVLERMAGERVTVFPGVPTIFSLLMQIKGLDHFDLSALRTITSAAAALSEEHIRRLRALFPQARLYSMYGQTECKRATYLPPEQLDIRPASVGRGMPNVELWLVDEEGNRLPDGSTGELVIRGSNVMRGYWRKPEETARRLRPGPLPGELVLHTGDLFRSDAEGWLHFVARKDDIIMTRGEKVSPREVENAIFGLEGVLEVAVIGVADEVLGQAVKAFVVPREGIELTEREVIRHCLAHLENFMAPKTVAFVPGLPKTDTGKIRKIGLA